MPTFNPAPFNETKPETTPAVPTTADQRAQHTNGNASFQGAYDDVAALETGKEDVGVAASEVSDHNIDANAHTGTFDAAGTATSAVADHNAAAGAHPGTFDAAGSAAAVAADLTTHEADFGNPHQVTAAQASAAPASHVGAVGILTHGLATTGEAGFSPPLSNVVTEFLNGTGNFSVPAGGGGGTGTLTTVRKNTGADVSTGRARLNFIEGANTLIDIADDGAGDEVDITITSTAAGGGGGDMLSPVAAVVVGELYTAADTGGVQTAGAGFTAADVARLDLANTFADTQTIDKTSGSDPARFVIQQSATGPANFRFITGSAPSGSRGIDYNLGTDGVFKIRRLNDAFDGVLLTVLETDAAGNMSLPQGNFDTATGQLLEQGARVYSPNNLPPATGEENTSTTPATPIGGNEADINMAKAGTNLPKRKLVGGANITLTQGADTITIAAADAGTGDVTAGTAAPTAARLSFWTGTGKELDEVRAGTYTQGAAAADDIFDLPNVQSVDGTFTGLLQAKVPAGDANIVAESPDGDAGVRFLVPSAVSIDERKYGIGATTLGLGTFYVERDDTSRDSIIIWRADGTVNAPLGELQEGGVRAIQPAAVVEAGATVTPTVAVGASPCLLATTAGALTVASIVGTEGSFELIIQAATSVTFSGTWTELGADPGSGLRACYLRKLADGSQLVQWGPAAA